MTCPFVVWVAFFIRLHERLQEWSLECRIWCQVSTVYWMGFEMYRLPPKGIGTERVITQPIDRPCWQLTDFTEPTLVLHEYTYLCYRVWTIGFPDHVEKRGIQVINVDPCFCPCLFNSTACGRKNLRWPAGFVIGWKCALQIKPIKKKKKCSGQKREVCHIFYYAISWLY